MADQEKRILRNLKRSLKRAGNKSRRQSLKRDLRDDPEEAAHSEESHNGYRSDWLNGIDNDSTRRRRGDKPDEEQPDE